MPTTLDVKNNIPHSTYSKKINRCFLDNLTRRSAQFAFLYYTLSVAQLVTVFVVGISHAMNGSSVTSMTLASASFTLGTIVHTFRLDKSTNTLAAAVTHTEHYVVTKEPMPAHIFQIILESERTCCPVPSNSSAACATAV